MFNKKDLVKCEECKHYIDRRDAQLVLGNEGGHYCPEHRKNYDEASFIYPYFGYSMVRTRFYKLIPARRVEVDKDGKVIK